MCDLFEQFIQAIFHKVIEANLVNTITRNLNGIYRSIFFKRIPHAMMSWCFFDYVESTMIANEIGPIR